MSKPKKSLIDGWLLQVMFSAILVLVIYFELTTKIEHLESQLSQAPKNVYVNTTDMLKSQLDKGESSQDALLYMQTYINVHKAMGYTVIEAESVLAFPDEEAATVIEKNALFEQADYLGVSLSPLQRRAIEQEMEKAKDEWEGFFNS